MVGSAASLKRDGQWGKLGEPSEELAAAEITPVGTAGEKGIVDEIVASGLIGLLLQAGKEIWLRISDDNALTRKTIQTQLEAIECWCYWTLAIPEQSR